MSDIPCPNHTRITVLDHGSVTLVRHMGTDLDVVNNARVSFGKRSDTLGTAEKRLISYLARGMTTDERDELLASIRRAATDGDLDDLAGLLDFARQRPRHWTPFAVGIHAVLRIKLPIFVARQLTRSTVGFAYSEVSGRYTGDEGPPDIFEPAEWRAKPDKRKQGSGGPIDYEPMVYEYAKFDGTPFGGKNLTAEHTAMIEYETRIAEGVSAELARTCLPLASYTEIVMDGSLAAWARLYVQRIDAHAQLEAQRYAQAIGTICEQLWPVSWPLLTAGAMREVRDE